MATALPYTPERRALSTLAGMPGGETIGRRPDRFMGMAQEVPRTALPPPAATGAVGPLASPGSLASRTQLATTTPGMGQMPSRFMGMADVVEPQRIGAPPVASAASLASRAMSAGRLVGPAGAALGIAAEGQQVVDVARQPGATGLDVAAQAAQGAGRIGAAGAGAAGGAAIGAMTGPLAPIAVPVGAIAGGALGYFSADRAIAGGRSLAERAMASGGATPPTSDYPATGGAAFGVFPQMPTGGTDANAPPAGGGGGRGTVNPPLADPNAPAPVAPGAAAPSAPSGFAPAGSVTDLGGFSAPAADRVAQLNRDAAFRRDMTQRELAQRVASGQEMAPGLAVIGPADYANRNAAFNAQANVNTLASRGAPPGRNGAAVFREQLAAAGAPLAELAAQQQTQAQQEGATQRAALAEQGLAARAQIQDARQAQSNNIAQQRVNIEAATAGLSNVPTGYRRTAAGGLEPIPGGPADPNTPKGKNTLNDTQAKALQFGTRMQQSGLILDRLAAQGVNQPGLIKRAADTVGVGAAANWTQSPEQQQVEQAQRDFVNATLRRESGAAISEGEFANARQQYFPQPGDSPQVIEQKRRNRELATQGFLAEVPDQQTRVQQVLTASGQAAPAAGAAGNAAAPSLPAGMSRQVGTSGGKPVYEDAQGRRFIGG